MAKRRPSGDGMVRKREDGRWEGRIVVGHKSNGDSIFRYISAPTQKELSAKLRQLTEAYKGVDLTEESNMALSVWLDKWLDEYMAATLRPTTLNGYRRSLELHVKPYLGNKTLSKITAVDLRSLYRTLQETGRVHPRDGQSPGLSARTVHGIHTTLHHALKTAMEQNLIPSNPAAEVAPPKFDGAPMKILTEAQLDAFMKVIEKDAFWHDFFYTAVTTGLRRGGRSVHCGGRISIRNRKRSMCGAPSIKRKANRLPQAIPRLMQEHGRSSCRPARHNSCGSERKQRRPNGYSLIPLIQSSLSPPAQHTTA